MKYAVYILGPGDKSKAENFTKDKDTAAVLKGAAMGAITDVLGVEFYDPAAQSLTDEKSVALSGKTITSMTYSTGVSFGTRYHKTNTEWEDVFSKILKHTLTIKGVLDANHAAFGISKLKDMLQKKDLSRIWTWANTPIGDTDDNYYRDVVATSFSTAQSRYRAITLVNASVGSYEEYFDKDGQGHFTLVINRVIDVPTAIPVAPNAIKVAGPSFDWNLTSVAGDVTKAAATAKKAADKGAAVAKKFGADTEAYEKYSKTTGKGIKTATDTFGKGKIDASVNNIGDQIKNVVDNIDVTKGDPSKKTETKIDTVESTGDDGEKIVTETTTNPDGSKVVKKTTTATDGTVTVDIEKFEA